MLVLIVLASALFSTFSLIIACIVKTRERFMGIGQFLTMPIFFASNAIYPLAMMPAWLRAISRVNPLSYEVDGLRSLMLAHGQSQFGLGARLPGVARDHRRSGRARDPHVPAPDAIDRAVARHPKGSPVGSRPEWRAAAPGP